MLANAPLLAHFDPPKPIEVRVDASGYGLGACLLQQHDEKGFKPVCYASRLMNSCERNYSTTEQECLAMIFALEKFRPYLEGQRFVLVTDHCALCWLKTKKKLPARLAR